jgi:peptidoglycan hydrolase-like protein with peptidoglycan-binding domain
VTAAANVERLELVRAALSGLGDGNPVALAAARSLLEARDLPLEDARVQLRAEALRLDEAIAKGRGGKAMGAPAAAAPAAPVEPVSPVPDGNYEALHPRGTGGMFIRKGDSGSHVSAMQTRLGELGHHQGQVDGNFGRQTLASVKSLQKAHGLPQTGVVDQRTLELMRMPPTTTKSQSSAQLRAALLAAGKTAKPGDVGENVSTVQGALGALGFQVNDPQGTYGPGTEAAVRQLQQRSGLAPTGRLDEQTAALIATATPGQENHAAGGLEGSDPSGWGLKPQGKRSPGRMTDKPSAGGANPRSKSSPRPRQGAKGGKAVKEATYSGTAAVAATAVTRTARILGITQPPNLREAPAASFDACASCVFFSGQSCLKYDGYPVDRDDLCDDWLTLTPAKDRPGRSRTIRSARSTRPTSRRRGRSARR